MNLIINEYSRPDKRTSELNEHGKDSTYDPTPSTSSWIPDPPEWLKNKKTTCKNYYNVWTPTKKQNTSSPKSILVVLSYTL